MKDKHTFHIYVSREAIGYGVREHYGHSGGWVRTSSHIFFQEALDEKDRTVAKGLDCILVNTSLEGWPTRTIYTAEGLRLEHPIRREVLKPEGIRFENSKGETEGEAHL